jgi:hypothetical protein
VSELDACYSVAVSVTSPTSGLDCSSAPPRRISSASLLKAPDSGIAAGTSVALGRNRSCSLGKDNRFEDRAPTKRLPIINPLVRLPMWPSKCAELRMGTFLSRLMWIYRTLPSMSMVLHKATQLSEYILTKFCAENLN